MHAEIESLIVGGNPLRCVAKGGYPLPRYQDSNPHRCWGYLHNNIPHSVAHIVPPHSGILRECFRHFTKL